MNYRRPRNILWPLSEELRSLQCMIAQDAPEELRAFILRIECYVTATNRGRADYRVNNVTVPRWAWNTGIEYAHYYLAHEIAHIIVWNSLRVRGHGSQFQAMLKQLTPYAHHELSYKPRLAAAAGISKPKE